MLSEAAKALGLSTTTLRKYIADDVTGLQPSHSVMFGKVEIYLYTDSDIKRMRETLDNRVIVRRYKRGGRPNKYDLDQRKERQRLFGRRYYWKRAMDRAIFFEDREKYSKAKEEIARCNAELNEMEGKSDGAS